VIFIKKSNLIIDNQQNFIDCIKESTGKLQQIFGTNDYTKLYRQYNIFGVTATNILMYSLFNELKTLVRAEIGNDRPLWMQSWVNYQDCNSLLPWHDHKWEWHGYICLEPKNTVTVFEDWEIHNKVGQIYFGEGHKPHRVDAVEPFDGHRITIGYDVTSVQNRQSPYLGLIPF
jgi:hypothetical protein